MVDERDIRWNTGSQAFQRGQLIFQCQGVRDVQIETARGEKNYRITRIEGSVVGSRRNYYRVQVEIDEERGEILSSQCECPEFSERQGLCKHSVALLMQYIQIRDAGHVNLFQRDSRMGLAGGRYTDPELARLLKRLRTREYASFAQPAIRGKVRLEPILYVDQDLPEMELRIGSGQMYVVKSIENLLDAVQNAAAVRYGKNLEFLHHMEAFTPEAQRMLQFLFRQEEQGMIGLGSDRRMDLTPSGMEELAQLMEDREFECHVEREREQLWHFTGEEPRRVLSVVGDSLGIHLRLQPMIKYQGTNYIYYFSAGKIDRISWSREPEIREFEAYMDSRMGEECFAAKSDLPLFVRNIYPFLERHYQIETENFDPVEYAPQPVEFRLYLDAPENNRITCDLVAVYGETCYHVFAGVREEFRRNVTREMDVGSLVSGYCNAFDEHTRCEVIIDDDEKIYSLLTEGIARFQEVAEVFISDRLKRIRVMPSPKVSAGISLSGDLLELTLDSGEMTLEELAVLLSRYDRKKHFYRLKTGAFVDLRDGSLAVLADMKRGLQISGKMIQKGVVTLPKYRALYLDAQFREMGGVPVQKNRDFKCLIRNMKTVEDNDFEVPKGLEKTLREYQKKGFLWLKTLKQNGFGGILADDMGLGKTLQVIAFLLSEQESAGDSLTRSLVVCPSSLVYNWQSELTQYAPELPVRLIVGNAQERRELIEGAGAGEILVTSYELLKRDVDLYVEIEFANQIIDEAQFIKNHATQAARAVKSVRAGCRIALTGTPVENRLSELWSIFDYLMPGYLYSYQRFREELEMPVVQEQDEHALVRLQKMIRPFVLRRLKKDVLKDLPEKLEKNMYARLEGEQLDLYKAHVQKLRVLLAGQSAEAFNHSRIQLLAELTKLRQLCCDPALMLENYEEPSAKLEMCLDLVENAVESGHKILLFSQFTTMLDRICTRLREKGIAHHLLTGSTPKEERMRMVQSFHTDDKKVFCISLKAGGTGLNLTAADIVIHFDPWWNTAVQNQATDRAHRIGQENTVTVYRLIAKGTIEEKIMKLQDRKQQLAEQVLGGKDLQNPTFTREELLELLE